MKDFALSRKNLKESLLLSIEFEDRMRTANVLTAVAGIKEPGTDLFLSLKLLGAAETVFMSLGKKPEDEELFIQEKIKKELRDKFSDEEYKKYFEKGTMMPLEEAVHLAINFILGISKEYPVPNPPRRINT